MGVINDADDLRIGTSGATSAWLNGVKVWPRGFSAAFEKFTGVIASDATATEAIVTEEGAVNYRRNGVAGQTRFTPICGESRFTDFTVADTLYTGPTVQPHLEWPLFYTSSKGDRRVWRVNLLTAAIAAETLALGSGPINYHAITSRPEVAYADALRGRTSTTAEQREWTKGAGSTPFLLATPPSPYDFGHFFLDADENYWIGGLNGYVHKLTDLGAVIWSTQLPGTGLGAGYHVAGMWVPDSTGNAICFIEDTVGVYEWYELDSATGAATNITAEITVDGTPWASAGMGVFGAPNVVTTQHGSRIGFKKGTDFYIATVT